MTPVKLLSLLADRLPELEGQYAIAGGLAASVYASQEENQQIESLPERGVYQNRREASLQREALGAYFRGKCAP